MIRARHWLAALLLLGLGACAAPKADQEAKSPQPASPEATQAQPGYGQTPTQGYGYTQQPGYAEAPGPAPGPSPTPPPGNILPKPEDQTFASLEDAQKALDKAKEELAAYAPLEKKKASDTPPAKPRSPRATALAEGDPRCESACKAFASLERAAKGVCRLTKDDDARCVRAKEIVEENRTRVAACKCSVSGG